MRGEKKSGKKDSFDVEEWKDELKKAAEGQYYHPGHDGLVISLWNDVGMQKDATIRALLNLPSNVTPVYDELDGVGETANNIATVAVNGVGKVKNAAVAACQDNGDDVIDQVVDGTTVVTAIADDVVEDVRSTVMESLMYEAAETFAEEATDVIPIVGLAKGGWNLIWGSAYMVVGVASLVKGAAVGAFGVVAAAAASPRDGGRLLKDRLEVAASSAAWGGSVMGQGVFGVVKGTCGIVGQIPGTQFVTMPVGFVAIRASKACKNARGA